jgi:hypothetical protein
LAISTEAVITDALEGPEGVDATGVGVATAIVGLAFINIL